MHLTRIDVPFLELTWFFIKCSLALALAFSVTSWLWVMIATGIGSLFAGLLYLVGVPILFDGAVLPAAVEGTPVDVPAVVVPEPEPEPIPVEPVEATEAPEPEPAPAQPSAAAPSRGTDPDAVSEALQREELERVRRERR